MFAWFAYAVCCANMRYDVASELVKFTRIDGELYPGLACLGLTWVFFVFFDASDTSSSNLIGLTAYATGIACDAAGGW